MSFHVEYTSKALSQLKKMDRFTARLILSWIENNLEGCIDPCRLGKGLTQIVPVNGGIAWGITESFV